MPKQMIAMSLLFGLFQALNPLLGWWGAELFRDLIESVDHWIAFVLLMFIGGKMFFDAIKGDEEVHENPLSFKTLTVLAIATSIDALAVGVTFAFLKVNIIPAISLIGVTTFIISFAGVHIGHRFGSKYEKKAELSGGIILICIGLKILLEHLGILL